MAQDASAARELYGRLTGPNAWDIVEAWVTDKEAETNHLEFKKKDDPKTNAVDPEDINALAKALSQFANTGTGLLVFGVDAGGGKAKGQSFDRVRCLDLIDDAEGFGGLVERRLKTFTDPAIGALAVHAVKHPGGKKGVVIVLVPESDGGPHCAHNASKDVNGRYYMRTAAGAQSMPHSVLAAMFGRTAQPRLHLCVRLIPVGSQPMQVEFRLLNAGRGVARRPAIQFHEFTSKVELVMFNSVSKYGFILRPHNSAEGVSRILCEASEELLIYPDMDRVCLFGTYRGDTLDHDMRFRGVLHALDMRPTPFDGILTFGQHEHQHDIAARRLILPPVDGSIKKDSK